MLGVRAADEYQIQPPFLPSPPPGVGVIVQGWGFPRILESSQNTTYLRVSAPAAACGNYKPELRGNDAPKDPTSVARARELNYEYTSAVFVAFYKGKRWRKENKKRQNGACRIFREQE